MVTFDDVTLDIDPAIKLKKNRFFFSSFSRHKGIVAACLEHHPDLAILSTFPSYCGLTALQDVLPRKIPYIVVHTVPAYPTSEFLPTTANVSLITI